MQVFTVNHNLSDLYVKHEGVEWYLVDGTNALEFASYIVCWIGNKDQTFYSRDYRGEFTTNLSPLEDYTVCKHVTIDNRDT